MPFYDDMQKIATDLLTQFNQGKIVLLKGGKGVGPAYNPGEVPPVEIPLAGVARGVLKKYVNGTTIVESDMQLTVAVSTVAPTMDDAIQIDGRRYKIVGIKPIPPAGTVVANNIIFR